MAFREKVAYLSLGTNLLIWGYYFSMLAGALGSHHVGNDLFIGTFIGCVVLSVLVQIALNIALAVLSPKDAASPVDERERLIDLNATRIAYHLMSGGVMTVVLMSPILAGGAPFVFGANEATGSAVTLVANGVIFFVVLADVARCASLILRYRRDSLA
jgi:hypothetical protein